MTPLFSGKNSIHIQKQSPSTEDPENLNKKAVSYNTELRSEEYKPSISVAETQILSSKGASEYQITEFTGSDQFYVCFKNSPYNMERNYSEPNCMKSLVSAFYSNPIPAQQSQEVQKRTKCINQMGENGKQPNYEQNHRKAFNNIPLQHNEDDPHRDHVEHVSVLNRNIEKDEKCNFFHIKSKEFFEKENQNINQGNITHRDINQDGSHKSLMYQGDLKENRSKPIHFGKTNLEKNISNHQNLNKKNLTRSNLTKCNPENLSSDHQLPNEKEKKNLDPVNAENSESDITVVNSRKEKNTLILNQTVQNSPQNRPGKLNTLEKRQSCYIEDPKICGSNLDINNSNPDMVNKKKDFEINVSDEDMNVNAPEYTERIQYLDENKNDQRRSMLASVNFEFKKHKCDQYSNSDGSNNVPREVSKNDQSRCVQKGSCSDPVSSEENQNSHELKRKYKAKGCPISLKKNTNNPRQIDRVHDQEKENQILNEDRWNNNCEKKKFHEIENQRSSDQGYKGHDVENKDIGEQINKDIERVFDPKVEVKEEDALLFLHFLQSIHENSKKKQIKLEQTHFHLKNRANGNVEFVSSNLKENVFNKHANATNQSISHKISPQERVKELECLRRGSNPHIYLSSSPHSLKENIKILNSKGLCAGRHVHKKHLRSNQNKETAGNNIYYPIHEYQDSDIYKCLWCDSCYIYRKSFINHLMKVHSYTRVEALKYLGQNTN